MSEKLPYQAQLEEAGRRGRVLGRDDVYGQGPPVDAAHEELLDFIAQVSRQRILDIGCGLGPYVAKLNSRGFSCVGIEIEAEQVRAAVALGRPVLLMDGRALGFADQTFDTCLLLEVIEHVPDFELLLRKAARVVRRNIIVSVPNINAIPSLSRYNVVPWHMLEATHVNFFTPEILQRVLERIFAGQAKVRVEEYAPFFPWAEGEQLYYQIRAVIEMIR
jgi:2-polyprenyl-3-methyl-5-hydroxy-6-metoxy-1,4-benzoquinol methylase